MDEMEARALAERHLAEALPRRWRHVQAVADEVSRLCGELDVDRRVVVCAAWLHDIGYSPELVRTGFHPLDGARYLRSEHWDDLICRLVAHHTDAASHAVERGFGDELRGEFACIDGLLCDVLWTADATTGPDGQRVALDERIAELEVRYGTHHPVTKAMTSSRPALADAIMRVCDACR